MQASVETEQEGKVHAWRVDGMDCPSCVTKLERAVSRLPGAREVRVNLMAETLAVRLGPAGDPAGVERAVASLGFTATPRPTTPPATAADAAVAPHQGRCDGHAHEDHAHGDHAHGGHSHEPDAHAGHGHSHGADDPPGTPWWGTGKARLVGTLGLLVLAAAGLALLVPAWAYWLYLAATLVAVVPFAHRALALARAGSPFSIETLMVTAALGATVIGAAEEAAFVVLLFAVGELLEGVAAGQARAGIRALADLMPRLARVERGGAVMEVPAGDLVPGDVVQVRPGDRVPCDGTVLDGASAVDESPVTGESVPVPRGPGDPVVAGSVNAAALLRVRVTAAAADNTVSRIVRLVEEATASRAPTQRFIERFSTWWTPGAMAVSLLVMLAPPLLAGGEWATWVYRGLAVLLIACPCALVISVPAAVASGLSAGARRGLLVKGGAALEEMGKVRTVAFDKTGTLTEGRPQVTHVIAAEGVAEDELLRLAAGVEAGSAHPLAEAIGREAGARGIVPAPAADAMAVPGKAAAATIGGVRVVVGSPAHAVEAGATLDGFGDRIRALEEEGRTVVAVLRGGHGAGVQVLGVLALRDEPREDARAAVAALRGMGIRPVMLTGDNERTGRAVAAALGMDVRAALLPDRKLREIEALRADGPVAMVGDGINDAPALAAASVGVAMGGGTAVALETADAALLRARVSGVAELVALSRATTRAVRQNMAVALGLKVVFLGTTLAGVTGLWPAVMADTGATVLVTLNALRLLAWRPQASQ